MPVSYHSQNQAFTFKGKGKTSAWLREVARSEGCLLGAVSVVFCTDNDLLEVNKRYLGHDYFTDIITFDYGEKEKRSLSGDLMISVDTVRENALKFGVPFENELQRVIVHGVLHLCGHDDKSPSEQARMRALEDKYLNLFYTTNQ